MQPLYGLVRALHPRINHLAGACMLPASIQARHVCLTTPTQQCQAHTSHSALPIGGQLLAPTTQRSMPDVGWPTTAEHSEGRDEESCWKPPLILPWLKNSPAHTKAIPHKEPGKISTRRAVPSHTTFFVLLSARDLSPACPPPMLLLPPHKTLLLQSRARGTQDQLTHVFCFPPPLSRPRLL